MPGEEQFQREMYRPQRETGREKPTEKPGDEVQIFQRPENRAVVEARKAADLQRAEVLRQRLKDSMTGRDEEALTPLKTAEQVPAAPDVAQPFSAADLEDMRQDDDEITPSANTQELLTKIRARKKQKGGVNTLDLDEDGGARDAEYLAMTKNTHTEPVPVDSPLEEAIAHEEYLFAKGSTVVRRAELDSINNLANEIQSETDEKKREQLRTLLDRQLGKIKSNFNEQEKLVMKKLKREVKQTEDPLETKLDLMRGVLRESILFQSEGLTQPDDDTDETEIEAKARKEFEAAKEMPATVSSKVELGKEAKKRQQETYMEAPTEAFERPIAGDAKDSKEDAA